MRRTIDVKSFGGTDALNEMYLNHANPWRREIRDPLELTFLIRGTKNEETENWSGVHE